MVLDVCIDRPGDGRSSLTHAVLSTFQEWSYTPVLLFRCPSFLRLHSSVQLVYWQIVSVRRQMFVIHSRRPLPLTSPSHWWRHHQILLTPAANIQHLVARSSAVALSRLRSCRCFTAPMPLPLDATEPGGGVDTDRLWFAFVRRGRRPRWCTAVRWHDGRTFFESSRRESLAGSVTSVCSLVLLCVVRYTVLTYSEFRDFFAENSIHVWRVVKV